jgi:GNAT superfamily N-acetyltransferase
VADGSSKYGILPMCRAGAAGDDRPVPTLTPLPISPAFDCATRRAGQADLPTLGYVLAAAFHADPVMRWVIPDDAGRRVRLPALMELYAARVQRHGENRINESGTGAAVWAPPGAEFTPDEDARFEAGLIVAGGRDLGRLGAVAELLDAHHPAEPHWYLMLAGVIPDRQGAGIGGALLRAVLAGADRAGLPAYLEATSPRNRALYERHGFTVTAELRTADCPPLWAMWRAPAAG